MANTSAVYAESLRSMVTVLGSGDTGFCCACQVVHGSGIGAGGGGAVAGVSATCVSATGGIFRG